jgi:iron-sulfur cluster assembly protein
VGNVLTITSNAAEAIEAILTSTPGLSDDSGLRIAPALADDGQPALGLAFTETPEQGDQVVDEAGVHVFLDPEAAAILDDKVLDAQVEEGQVGFTVTEQAGADLHEHGENHTHEH